MKIAIANGNRRQTGGIESYLSTLAPALGLYRAMGFVDTNPPARNDYVRGDTWMERRY